MLAKLHIHANLSADYGRLRERFQSLKSIKSFDNWLIRDRNLSSRLMVRRKPFTGYDLQNLDRSHWCWLTQRREAAKERKDESA